MLVRRGCSTMAARRPPTFDSTEWQWSLSDSVASVNAIQMAGVFDRLERGLPIIVGAVGGSNMQGHALKWTETVLPVLTAWLNEHFPVNTSDVDALEADRAALRHTDCGTEARSGKETAGADAEAPRHRFLNTAAGGTTSALTSFCYRR